MADRKWRKWELAGLFVTLILGNLLHFVFDWSGENSIVAAFAAVNESTWEHMKLLVIPWVVWSLVEAVVLRVVETRRGSTCSHGCFLFVDMDGVNGCL